MAAPSVPPRVWIVDDSPLDADRARRAVLDYDVELFADGSAALEALASETPPDVMVLDWMMPGISGPEVCRFIRGPSAGLVDVGLLLLTARQETEQVVEGLAAGANDFLSKPYAEPELRARVDALLRTKRLVDRAERAERTVRELLATAPDALVAVDAAQRVTFANEEALRAFGCDAEALKGRPLRELLPTLRLDAARPGPDGAVLPLSDVAIGGQVFEPFVRFLSADPSGHATISLRNVTRRRRADARRLDLYSVLAHDLRSPLMAITLRGEALLRRKRELLPADVIAHLQKTQANTSALLAMVNDFLDLARLEGTGYRLEREELRLEDVLARSAEELRPLAEAKGLTLALEPVESPALVYADPRRLSQVTTNLLGNAIKFTPPGGRVSARITASGADVEASIEDTGPGIPAEALPTLFDRYSRVENDGQAGGTGLGLMIVREIVEAHGGEVGVESRPGKGSRFWFRLRRVTRGRPAAAG